VPVKRRILITPGEPAGIGPDLCLQILQRPPPVAEHELVLVASPQMLDRRAAELGLPRPTLPAFERGGPRRGASIVAVDMPCPVSPGKAETANALYVLKCLDEAVALCRDGDADALVTGPVNKAMINEAGIAFSGIRNIWPPPAAHPGR